MGDIYDVCFKMLCFPTNSQNPKNSSFTVLSDKERQHIITFKEMETAKIKHFCL